MCLREKLSRHLNHIVNQLLVAGGLSGVGVAIHSHCHLQYMQGFYFVSTVIYTGTNEGALEIAGICGEHVVLFIEDFQITKEAIPEMINSLLSSGE